MKINVDVAPPRSSSWNDLLPQMLDLFVDDEEAALASADDDLEYITIDQNNIESWIESQLLDCQTLARRHGLLKFAAHIEQALEMLMEDVVEEAASPEDNPESALLFSHADKSGRAYVICDEKVEELASRS